MGQLHELLAVEAELRGKAEKILEESRLTFLKKHEHFVSIHKTYKPDDEKEQQLDQADETKPMVETVAGKLGWTVNALGPYLDCLYQKELANTKAHADLVVNGKVVAKAVPATVLLTLESRLKSVRELYNSIPTLTPGENWQKNSESGHYRVEEKRVRTAKVLKNHIKAPATDKHPAQVETYTADERQGMMMTVKESSMLSPLEKAELLTRVDNLLNAVKQARMRANTQTVDGHARIAEKLFAYVNTGAINDLEQS